ncbi:glycosyltransferase family 2 protein [Belnapia sp. T6]|uniref:Glycosyltransferase family 2 protein n=1 Tax=Belnapia mucosa TaxID=2804532 RepID=A0ABS1V518_9PROT|nr:glycosyltransferase family 2 protein [Belnapia mucosa]MBL6456702.1 glycosyltransferase family 2 protein [Belnapia mucosa]
MVLLGLRGGILGIDMGSVSLASAAGPVEPPMSWQSVPVGDGELLSLLLLRAQPGVEPGTTLLVTDELGGSASLELLPAESLQSLLDAAPPASILRVAGFIASRAIRPFRRGDDAALAAACHALAAQAGAPERHATPVALCGEDVQIWSLPRDLAPAPTTSLVIGRHRLRQASHAGGMLLLADRRFEGGYLLPAAGGEGPVHLAPASGRLPTLGELARRTDAPGRALYRAALQELSRRAAEDEAMRRLLRDHLVLAPLQPLTQVTELEEPFGGALEMALDDHAGGLFLRGWLRDPLGLIGQLTLQGSLGNLVLQDGQLIRFPRPDLVKKFAEAPHGSPGIRAGFVLHLPEAAAKPSAQWRLRVRLRSGDQVTLVAPPAITTPLLARDRILGAIAPPHVTPEILTRCIAPPVERLHRRIMEARQPPEVVRIGPVVADPVISLIVPIYRNVHYLRHQLAAIARDPALRQAELIYVLDSPEQREELEFMLRGQYGITRQPVTLVVQPANYGYGSACNAGVAEARAPVLLLLNSDVVPAGRGWLAPLLGTLAAAPHLVAVGPKLLYANDSLQHAGLYFERPETGDWHNNHYYKGLPRRFPRAERPREVPGITGAAFCVRREAFQKVGGFTTDYVVGDYEDSDLCLKLRADGGGIGYVPAAELYHFERQSITLHTGYTRSLTATYNRNLHHRRWSTDIAALMARDWPLDSIPAVGPG